MIEKRLEYMANRQNDFMDKLENVIGEKRARESEFYVAQSKIPLNMWTLKIRRFTNSILLSFRLWQGRVRVEKSGNDLMVRFDGFYQSLVLRIVPIFCGGTLLAISIGLIIFGFFFAPHRFTGVLDQTLWLALYLMGFVILLVMATVRTYASRKRTLNNFIEDCIQETVNLFEGKEPMQRQPLEPSHEDEEEEGVEEGKSEEEAHTLNL